LRQGAFRLKIAIVGLGLIGGSLGKTLKVYNLKTKENKYSVLGIARRKETLSQAIKIGAADETSLSLSSASGADIVVISTPVDFTASIYEKLSAIVKKETIITDVGSVKYSIEKAISKIYKKGKNPPFVFAHPMTGKEKNGLVNSEADLFENTNVVITASIEKSIKNENIIAQMWRDTGANIIKMSSKQHDNLVALTSHIPHLSAFALNKIYKDKKRKVPQIEKIVAGSFYSAIRVASSSADMWAPIFEYNKINIKENLRNYIEELKRLEKTLGDKEKSRKEILKTQS
jgi:prephenate dehydrogenase